MNPAETTRSGRCAATTSARSRSHVSRSGASATRRTKVGTPARSARSRARTPGRSEPTATTWAPYAGSVHASSSACRLVPLPETSTTSRAGDAGAKEGATRAKAIGGSAGPVPVGDPGGDGGAGGELGGQHRPDPDGGGPDGREHPRAGRAAGEREGGSQQPGGQGGRGEPVGDDVQHGGLGVARPGGDPAGPGPDEQRQRDDRPQHGRQHAGSGHRP